MAEIITSLVGVVVGFLLAQAANLFSMQRVIARRRKSSRTLVSLEVTSNLELLSDFWQNVTLEPEENDPDEVAAERYGRRATEIPLPFFAELAWSSQLDHLPEVLSENELTEVWTFYDGISKIRVLHRRLVSVRESGAAERISKFPRSSRAMKHSGLSAATFHTESAAIVYDLRQMACATLEAGNPLTE